VVANRYQGSDQGVGAHADRLTYIGPRPTIASLTLGAQRVFRVQKIQSGASPTKSFDISLPQNSLLIMFPPMQVRF
jgi:alkylated DNA repair dioxygenase AlkB